MATCSVLMTVSPTEPEDEDAVAVPLALYFSDSAGDDVTHLTVQWTWVSP